jgi:hypothetical protein
MRYLTLLFICIQIINITCSRNTSGRFCNRTDHDKISLDTVSVIKSCMNVSSDLIMQYGDKDTSGMGFFYMLIDKTADSLKRHYNTEMIDRRGAAAITGIIYDDWKIGFDSNASSIESILPHRVYYGKKGTCMGVALMMLMLAEKTQCPLYGVMLPGHILCRFDNGTNRFNMEPNRHGIEHSDEYYMSKYNLSKWPWHKFRNMTVKEVTGALCFDIGTYFMINNKYSAAEAYLKAGCRNYPELAEAEGNLAIAMARNGKKDSADILFKKLLMQYPGLENLKQNYTAFTEGNLHLP